MTSRHISSGRRLAAFALALGIAGSGACSSDETAPADSTIPSGTDGTETPGSVDPSTSVPVPDGSDTPVATGPAPADTNVPPPASTPPAPVGGNGSGGGEAGPSSGGMGGAGTAGGGTGAAAGGVDNQGGAGSGGGGAAGASGGAGAVAGMGGGGASGGSSPGGAGGAATGGGGASGVPTDPNSPGCGTPITRPDRNVQQTMEIGGTTRYYLLDVPQNADNETPLMLIFGLHGFDMNNIAVKDLYNFTERSGGQAITVMPQGEGPPPGDVSHWGDGVLESTWSPNQANYDYIEALIETIGESYCIDRSRVFIVGFSMGAFFTNAIACAHNDWFRGFAPIAGGGPSSCGDGVEAAIIVQHGTADPIVDISSGEGSRDIWLEQNGCSQSSSPTLDGCESYDGCSDGKPVLWCTGNYDHYIPEDVTSNIWSFFSSL